MKNHQVGDQFMVHGKTYKTVKEHSLERCSGCAFDTSRNLCLNDKEIEIATHGCLSNHVIFIEMKEEGEK